MELHTGLHTGYTLDTDWEILESVGFMACVNTGVWKEASPQVTRHPFPRVIGKNWEALHHFFGIRAPVSVVIMCKPYTTLLMFGRPKAALPHPHISMLEKSAGEVQSCSCDIACPTLKFGGWGERAKMVEECFRWLDCFLSLNWPRFWGWNWVCDFACKSGPSMWSL